MILHSLYFWGLAASIVVCSLGVILHRNPVVCAVYLIACLFGVAGLFLGLHAPFLAAIQILVYAGAVMVLFIFVMMLLNLKVDPERFSRSKLPRTWKYLVSATLLISLLALISMTAFPNAVASVVGGYQVHEIATLLFTKYLFPFELASYLLLIAMVGGVVMAKKTK
ncbi:MAG: hypothetical protein A3B70_05945 [Deltaproteobacteria bacterium RIFCSPHIGHO2_02_FULL_40_11]|nr:MAG: hypothetical protein A3B70_05945 [Deltaproteobacteria bacterium RIFCSPHIGHO2_02_FULL_40_11]